MTAPAGALSSAAVYRRAVGAGIERVWENVHDWEHLPWLHGHAFSAIELQDVGDWGWRARIGLQPQAPDNAILLELVVEDERSYVSRTLEGSGAGGEIWTRLTPERDDRTAIEVEFLLPGIAPEHRDAVGRAFTQLYARLWDEDEAMMQRRDWLLRAPRPAEGDERERLLGSVTALRPRLPLQVEFRGRPWQIAEIDGAWIAHAIVCPHWLGPLTAPPADGVLVCPWHGFRFDPVTGASCDGRRLRLPPAPCVVVDLAADSVRLVASDAQAS